MKKVIRLTIKNQYLTQESVTVTVTADPQNKVDEKNENNNTKSITVTRPPAPTQLSDLRVTGISFTPANPTVRDKVMIRVDMKNAGQGEANFCKGVKEWMVVEGPKKSGGVCMSKRTVAPGGTFFGGVYIINPGDLAAGSFTFKAKVDPDNKNKESNDNNNTLSKTLSISN